MHLKRSKTEKFWPIPRKGTKYVAVPTHNKREAVPLAIIMRDVLKFVKTKKELKKILNEKQVFINGRVVKETNFPLCLFDVLSLPSMKKNYRVSLSKNKKITLEEISDKEAETRVYRVIGKKILSGGKIQINLMHGKNLLFDKKIETGDSIVFNFKENKIVKILPLKENKNVFVVKGRHAGVKGKIERIFEEGNKKIAEIVTDNQKIKVWTKNIVIIE